MPGRSFVPIAGISCRGKSSARNAERRLVVRGLGRNWGARGRLARRGARGLEEKQ